MGVVRAVEVIAADATIQHENGVVEVMHETVMQEVHAAAEVNGAPGLTMEIQFCKLSANLS